VGSFDEYECHLSGLDRRRLQGGRTPRLGRTGDGLRGRNPLPPARLRVPFLVGLWV